jgi:phytoene dehydrogenase-like protein
VHAGTATLKSATDVNDWFTYHASEEDFEVSDQAALEAFWTKLHTALPELGGDIEIIDTANPRTLYDQTRRKLGMILGSKSKEIPVEKTSLPNLFVIGDTVSPTPDLAAISETALSLATHLLKKL